LPSEFAKNALFFFRSNLRIFALDSMDTLTSLTAAAVSYCQGRLRLPWSGLLPWRPILRESRVRLEAGPRLFQRTQPVPCRTILSDNITAGGAYDVHDALADDASAA
jgi:hypothetical protein